jgi:YYY domain-containing protein
VNKILRRRVPPRRILHVVSSLALLASLTALIWSLGHLFGGHKSLLLTAQQIASDQQSPPFGVQFPAHSFANAYPILFWWLCTTILGLLAYPLAFAALRGLADRGYIFSKTLGILLLAYVAWILANTRLVAFSHLSMLIVLALLLAAGAASLYFQRRAMLAFLRQRWRLLLVEESLFMLAFLLFVLIRSLDPDLWNLYLGGEKPMELAFLNAVLRSPYMPPLDPWYAGGYINYYYYGYIVMGALVKLTGIAPATAFNLAIPTLFALTFTGAFSIVYSFTRRLPFALLGGYFAALIGNFDGLLQLKGQLQAALAHLPIPAFSYWRSSRIIPFTINEFPFWSFLFADLHPHVIDMPVVVLMLGIIAALFTGENMALYALAAFVLGTNACINPWDMPVYALLLCAAVLLRRVIATAGQALEQRISAVILTLAGLVTLFALAFLLYWPFYAGYQQLYVNGLGLVTSGTSLADYLTINNLWLFLALTFFLLELYRWWTRRLARTTQGQTSGLCASALDNAPVLDNADSAVTQDDAHSIHAARRVAGYLALCGVVLTVAALPGLKMLLLLLIVLGAFLLFVQQETSARYITMLLLDGLCISLGLELIYVRDFLDGSAYARMNSVFKFSIQAWFCFAVGGALAAHHLWKRLRGFARRAWLVGFAALLLANSAFLPFGTLSRLADHQAWAQEQPPLESANYLPTLDGAAFMRAWYPGDAQAIAWINQNIPGSPVILEAASPYASFSWFNRVSVYTGLPDVLGWPDHVGEQRNSEQVLNRLTDIGIIYTTQNQGLALLLLHQYHVRFIYVGALERQVYTRQSTAGLDKFDAMLGTSLRVIYRSGGVTIYEVID